MKEILEFIRKINLKNSSATDKNNDKLKENLKIKYLKVHMETKEV